MSTIVSGSLRLSNGQKPGLCIETSFIKGYLENGSNLTYQCKIIGGNILVEVIEGFQEEEVIVDEIFRISRHIVDNLILSQVALEGIGLTYTLEVCKTHTGEVIDAQPDFIPQLEEIKFEYQDIFDLISHQRFYTKSTFIAPF